MSLGLVKACSILSPLYNCQVNWLVRCDIGIFPPDGITVLELAHPKQKALFIDPNTGLYNQNQSSNSSLKIMLLLLQYSFV